MKSIPLCGKRGAGKFAVVSDSRYEYLRQFKWFVSDHGYAYRPVWKNNKQTNVYMHHEVLGVPAGSGRRLVTDHIDGDRLNNQDDNLRRVSSAANVWNSKKRENNTVGAIGVVRTGGKRNPWAARILNDGEMHYLGRFPTLDAAAAAYKKAAAALRGVFSRGD